MAYVIRKGSKFYLAESKRTKWGPRQTCTYIGSGPQNCRTLAELKAHLIKLKALEEAKRRVVNAPLRKILKTEDGNMAACLKRNDWQAIIRQRKPSDTRLRWISARIDRITSAMAEQRSGRFRDTEN